MTAEGGRMERVKGKWVVLDAVDVCRREAQRDERKGLGEERVEIMRVAGREKDV